MSTRLVLALNVPVAVVVASVAVAQVAAVETPEAAVVAVSVVEENASKNLPSK
jgi:hypothetical protein